MKKMIIGSSVFIVLALVIIYANLPSILEFIGKEQDEVTSKYHYIESY